MRPAARGVGIAILAAAPVLALVACAPAVDPDQLLARLMSPDVEVREEAQDKVAEIIQKNQSDVFLRGLKSANPLYRAQSMVFLARMSDPKARNELRSLLALDRRMLLPFNPVRYKPQSDPTDSRILAASLIHRSGGDPEAIKVLLDGVDADQSAEIQTGTAFAVGALRDPAGIPFLDTLSQRSEVEVVRASLEAAAEFPEPAALAILERLATHPSVEVRADVLSSISSRREPEILELFKKVGQSDPSDELRSVAYNTLAQFKPAEVVPYLVDRLKDASPGTRPTILENLGHLTGQALGPSHDAWARWLAKNGAGLPAR